MLTDGSSTSPFCGFCEFARRHLQQRARRIADILEGSTHGLTAPARPATLQFRYCACLPLAYRGIAMRRHGVTTDSRRSVRACPSALPQGRPPEHYVVRPDSAVMSAKALHGKGNATERKAKCKIKGRRHQLFKSWIRFHKACAMRSRCHADHQSSHQLADGNRDACPKRRADLAVFFGIFRPLRLGDVQRAPQR